MRRDFDSSVESSGKLESLPLHHLESFPMNKDGLFEITGIPTGNWRFILRWEERFGPSSSLSRELVLAQVDGLREGERRKLDLDVDRLVFAFVKGTVLLNGKPYHGRVEFRAGEQTSEDVMTNTAGKFETFLAAGSHRVHIYDPYEDRHVELFAEDRLHLTSDQQVQATIRIAAATLRVRVVGSDGKLRSEMRLLGRPVGASETVYLGETDKRGLATSQLLMPGSYQLRIWPKRLADDAARRRFLAEHEGDSRAFEDVLVDVTKVVAKAGSDEVIEIRLPVSTGY